MIVSVPAPPPMLASPPPCPACNSTAVARISASRRRMPMRIPYMRGARYLRDGGAHKLDPHLGIERRAADQHAVELLFGEQFHGVLDVDTAAVQEGVEAGGDHGFELLARLLVGFAEHVTALGMPDQRGFGAGLGGEG